MANDPNLNSPLNEPTQEAPTLSLSLGGGPGEIKEVVKAEHFKATLKRLVKYLKPNYPMLFFMMLIAAIGAWFAIWVPDILKKVTNTLVESIQFFKDIKPVSEGGNGQLYTYIAPILIVSASLYVLNALFQFLAGMIAAIQAQSVVRRMRSDVKDKLDKVALSYFDCTTVGEVLSRFTIDIEMVSLTLQESLNQIISGTMIIVGVFVMMVRIDWLLALIALVSLPLLLIVSLLIVKKSQVEFSKQQRKIGELNGHIEEMYTGHNIIKLYNYEDKSIEKYEVINMELRKATRRSQFLAGIILPSIKFINNLTYVSMCIGGGFRAGSGVITIGDIQAMLSYTKQFAQPIESISNIANTIQSAIAAAERVFQIFDLEEMSVEGEKSIDLENIQGRVTMKNIKFSYVKDIPLITDLSLDVKEGESIAIVGPTGAGKTTLVNLLMRFYEIDGGEILIDGINMKEFSRTDLRSLYGMVLQDTWLFSGTIAENISYGRPNATRDEIIAAAKEAYAHTFIMSLEDGYETILKEDAANISAGQKQLLTIARAILKQPKIIILDEATSSVDTMTEKYIQSAMLAMMEGRTSFVIAHRLSTIRSANVILVMNQGDVIEKGNHEELIAKQGFYYDLYNSQFAGEEDDMFDVSSSSCAVDLKKDEIQS
ncbi:MAG TPA: ABC transporter ATP-binding protein [Clostridiales bacterium]|nr:ABC transporter ATP-binding protein [Clostridiales bacterium]